MTTKLFSELGLSSDLLKAIDKLGFEQAAPIQAAAIPVLLDGKDAVGQSQTGSGKTVAFAAPAIERVVVEERVTQVLILCPTRELAVQVTEEVHKLALFKRGLHAVPIYGGQSYDRQFFSLRQGAHIVIGTPGRIMDHMRRGTLRLDKVKIVVLDEVDVMLNMGFRDDMELILQGTPTERQTVFFSATVPRPIQQLIEQYSRDPQTIRIEQKAMTVPTVEQVYYEIDRRYKVDLLTRLIDIHDLKLGIIFCNTRRMVDDLVEHLNAQGYSADRLHGEMTQTMRDRVMNRFRKSGLEFLVATDVAARGIDVENIEVVFNYDLPYDGEDYVHRIGRTGRQGRSGRAISFASGREVFQIRQIERYVGTRIHRAHPPTIEQVEEARANAVLDKVRATLKQGEFKRQDQLVERLLEEGFSSTDIASALLHLLQGGEALAAAPSRREEAREPRQDRRAPYADQRPEGRHHERERRYRDERDYRRERPPAPRRHEPTRAAPVKQVPPAAPSPRVDQPPAPRPAAPAPELPQAQSSSGTPPSPSPQPSPSGRGGMPDRPAKFPRPGEPRRPGAAPAESIAKPKPSRPTAEGHTRLHLNVGAETGVSANDIVATILGHTGLPKNVVGPVDVRGRHTFVDVASEHARSIIAKLNRAEVKGRKARVKVA